jgi:hypothetical protein
MPDLAAQGRDPRLDFTRGLANWFILLDHIPHNVVSLLTLRNFGFSGATDLFVFAAGYAAAMIYGRLMWERGFIVAATRIFKRAWRLYAAYIVLFVLYVNAIGFVATQSAADALIGEYNVTGMIDHPVRMLAHGLTLQTRVLNLDALQLFIALLAAFPFVLACMVRWPNLTMFASAALYAAARLFDWSLPAFPDGTWYFNPFCWQLLFVFGAWFALAGRQINSLYHLPALRIAALLYLVFALALTIAARSPRLAGLIPHVVLDAFAPDDRENLAPYRVLHFLALAFIFTWLVPRDWRGFQSRTLQPIIICGEEWLAAFCAGVFLSFAGHFVLITGPDSFAMQLLVSVAGLTLMTAVAYYIAWSRRQDRISAIGAKA